MLSSTLAAVLGPFAGLSNKHAMSNIYKTLEIGPTKIRGCSPWGILEADFESGVQETFWIDSAHFTGLVRSLPAQELTFTLAANALAWSCGSASGKLALHARMEIPSAVWPDWSHLPQPAKDFLDCLELGALACGSQSMASAGIYGVSFDNTSNGLMLSSSDSVTMAVARVTETAAVELPQRFVLAPDAAKLLGIVLKQKSESPAAWGFVKVREFATPGADPLTGIYATSGGLRLMLKAAPNLKQDILALASAFAGHEVIATIPADRIATFVRRAGALAESRQNTFVTLSVHAGSLGLSFIEGAAVSDELFLIEGLDVPSDLPAIRLDSTKLARVLMHTDKLVLDHLERGVVVFISMSPEFSYFISGAA